MSREEFLNDLESCINLYWYDIPEEIQNKIDKVYQKYSKEEDKKITKEFEKLETILNKKWDKWVKSDKQDGWFEIEHMLMSDNYGYSYTDDCEWVKHMNGKIYYFGQF